MAEQITVVAQVRGKRGTSAARNLRRSGLLPGIVYGEGKQARSVELNAHEFSQILRHHASGNLIIDLKVGDAKPAKVLLKEVQHHPVSGRIIHADFYEISMTQKLRVEIPVELVGEPVGVSQQGGVLEHLLRYVEVECLAADILEQVNVDVAALSIGDSLTVASIPLPKDKYTIITGVDIAVAAVSAPRIVEEEVAPVVEGAVPTEPEVITAKKEEGEEEGGEEGGEKKSDGKKPEAKKPEAKKPEAKKPEAKKK